MSPRPSDPIRLVFTFLFLSLASLAQYAYPKDDTFYFYWPTVTSQCGVFNLTWNNGTAPYTAWIIPIYSQPFIYYIPEKAYSNGAGSFPIELQIPAGSADYVVVMSDANGLGTGGSSELQSVSKPTAADAASGCVGSAPANQTGIEFSFQLAGQDEQCMAGFDLDWSAGSSQDGPYNFTVIPLDQSFMPYDVPLSSRGPEEESDWKLNLTAGSRFTVMMNSANGYGTGGIAGVYQVTNSSSNSCVTQPVQPTGPWPSGVATNTLDSATVAITSMASNPSGNLPPGAIAGVVVGVLAVILIFAVALWFLLRRRRRRRQEEEEREKDRTPYDISGTDQIGQPEHPGYEDDHVVEPFQHSPTPPFSSTPGSWSHAYDGIEGAGFAVSSSSSPSARFSRDAELAGEEIRTPGSAPPLEQKSSYTTLRPHSPYPSPGLAQQQMKTQTPPGMTRPMSGLRVVNQDNESEPPTPISRPVIREGRWSQDSRDSGERRREIRGQRSSSESPRQPGFRRHADGGRVSQEVVDLPPLYTDVPRDEPVTPRQEGMVTNPTPEHNGLQ